MRFDLDRFCRTLVREMADAVIYADAEGLIVFWNKGAERIFGFSETEAVGNSLDLIIPENMRKRHWSGYERTMRTGKTRYGSGDVLAVPALRKDGLRISIEFTILPLYEDAGRMLGIAAVLRDVTERFAVIKELREELARLSRSPKTDGTDSSKADYPISRASSAILSVSPNHARLTKLGNAADRGPAGVFASVQPNRKRRGSEKA